MNFQHYIESAPFKLVNRRRFRLFLKRMNERKNASAPSAPLGEKMRSSKNANRIEVCIGEPNQIEVFLIFRVIKHF